MNETVEARVEHRFRASAERVFDAWLDPATVRAWMARPVEGRGGFDVRRVEIDARVGGKFTFSDMRDGGEAIHWGYYKVIDRPRRLAFTWFTSPEDEAADNSVVTLTIEPQADGCIATLVHRLDVRWADWVGRTTTGWGVLLAKVDAQLAR